MVRLNQEEYTLTQINKSSSLYRFYFSRYNRDAICIVTSIAGCPESNKWFMIWLSLMSECCRFYLRVAFFPFSVYLRHEFSWVPWLVIESQLYLIIPQQILGLSIVVVVVVPAWSISHASTQSERKACLSFHGSSFECGRDQMIDSSSPIEASSCIAFLVWIPFSLALGCARGSEWGLSAWLSDSFHSPQFFGTLDNRRWTCYFLSLLRDCLLQDRGFGPPHSRKKRVSSSAAVVPDYGRMIKKPPAGSYMVCDVLH